MYEINYWDADGGRCVFFYPGKYRRMRYPVFAVEEDCLIVGDENGKDILIKSFWNVEKEEGEIVNHRAYVPEPPKGF